MCQWMGTSVVCRVPHMDHRSPFSGGATGEGVREGRCELRDERPNSCWSDCSCRAPPLHHEEAAEPDGPDIGQSFSNVVKSKKSYEDRPWWT
jgi:hypothetical protein